MRNFISYLFTSSIGFGVHYMAWVKGMIFFQVIDIIYLFFMAMGVASRESAKTIAPNITPFFWFMNLLSLGVNSWCFFGEGHTGQFFGSVYVMVSVIAMYGIAKYQIQNKTLN